MTRQALSASTSEPSASPASSPPPSTGTEAVAQPSPCAVPAEAPKTAWGLDIIAEGSTNLPRDIACTLGGVLVHQARTDDADFFFG